MARSHDDQAGPVKPGDLTAVETLKLALGATRSDGSPDWSIRVSAARALLRAPEPEQAPVVLRAAGRVRDLPRGDRRGPG